MRNIKTFQQLNQFSNIFFILGAIFYALPGAHMKSLIPGLKMQMRYKARIEIKDLLNALGAITNKRPNRIQSLRNNL